MSIYNYFTRAFNNVFSCQLMNMTTQVFLYLLIDSTIRYLMHV